MAATLTDSGELTQTIYMSFPIEKTETTADGDLMVYGKASDGTVDSDQQIVDPGWMAKAIREWLDTGANLRVQHNPQRDPAGVGLEATTDANGATWVKSLVVEPVAKMLVNKRALRAYSVGIARPTISRDAIAKGGRITDGYLAELSLVDRPANANCGIQLAKSAGDGTLEYVGKVFGENDVISKAIGVDTAKSNGHDMGQASEFKPAPPENLDISFTPNDLAKLLQSKIIERHYEELAVKAVTDGEQQLAAIKVLADAEEGALKNILGEELLSKDHREFSAEQREHQASAGHALPDGSYPIPDTDALRRAAILARSKHGNWQAASSLISRRAKELGVENPMSDSSDSEEKVAAPVVADAVIKAEEPVITKDPEDEQPKKEKAAKKPKKGKKLPPWMNASGDDDDDDASKVCKEDHAHTEKCSGTPQSEGGVQDSPPMKEIPDTGPAPESPMPAGRDTPDHHHKGIGTGDEVQAALMRFKSIGIDTEMGRLHDLTCPAYDPDEVFKYHPFADFKTLIDERVWQTKALNAAAGKSIAEAMELQQVWQAAVTLKNANMAELNDYRREMHKAFRDANPGPSSYPSPGTVGPKTFCRPVITDGHAANSPGHGSPNSSPSVASGPVQGAGQFDRPPLGSGHQSPSPSFMKNTDGEYPSVTGTPMQLSYGHIEKEKPRIALSMMHDHLIHQFPTACPMIEQDAYRQPSARDVPSVEGMPKSAQDISRPAGGDGLTSTPPSASKGDAPGILKATPEDGNFDDAELYKVFKKMEKKLLKKVFAGEMTISEAHDRLRSAFATKSLPPDGLPTKPKKLQVPAASKGEDKAEDDITAKGVSSDIIKSAMAEVLAPLTHLQPLNELIAKLDAQQALIEKQQQAIEENNKFIAGQEERWQKVAELTDPTTAGFSGLALNPGRAARGVVQKAEIAERAQQMMVRQLERTWRTSENPAEREAAFTALSRYRGATE
jgi:hypothetical protein